MSDQVCVEKPSKKRPLSESVSTDDTKTETTSASETDLIATNKKKKRSKKIGIVGEQNEPKLSSVKTEVFSVRSDRDYTELDSHESIIEAGRMLRDGFTVAFPTETVYGLGANALSDSAVKRIFLAKGRPSDNPLIVHIHELSQLFTFADSDKIPAPLLTLADKFWPGPLSLVIPLDSNEEPTSKSVICPSVRAGLQSVAVRMPQSPVALALIRQAGVPIAAPSANLSGRPSPTQADHVIADLSGRIDAVIDGGPCCTVGLESTVVKWSNSDDSSDDYRITILRPGAVTATMISEALKIDISRVGYALEVSRLMKHAVLSGIDTVDEQSGLKEKHKDEEQELVPESPGMKYTHYSPSLPLFVFAELSLLSECVRWCVSDSIGLSVGLLLASDSPILANPQSELGLLSKERSMDDHSSRVVCKSVGSESNSESVARALFDCLRHFDDQSSNPSESVSLICCQAFSFDGLGLAVMNRLLKAAGSKVVRSLAEFQSLVSPLLTTVDQT